ncbi:inositol polyphosphate multikinase [Gouania willdenowi]|uniref:Kinase n=1 Tax=Gouania willdenowi TaxID=441366 RepID=A0A8C5GTL8_GOUWI|nr:inositol polyphosphate multikinase [Gouania willdenowi]
MSAAGASVMEPSLAIGRLDLSSNSTAVGVLPDPEKPEALPVLPQGQTHLNGCVPLSHQVAGHKYGVDKVGILQHPDGTVLKQLQPPPRGPREMQFYSMVYEQDCCDPCLLELQKHLPKYYGTWSSPDCPNDLYLKLEDVTRRFNKPCIMDVKLGQRSYDPHASQEKREQQVKKYPLMEEIGFLLLGMRVYKVGSDTFDSYDQHYGRSLTKDTIRDGLVKFFKNGVSLRKDAVSASIRKVQRILQWFESQQRLAFFASSLLFVYEGLPSSFSSSSSFPCSAVIVTKTSSVSDDGKTKPERAGESLAEYNNNHIEVAEAWDHSLSTVCDLHHVMSHGKCGDDCVEVSASSVCEKNISELCEDNSSWKQPGEPLHTPNANGNKSMLEGHKEEEVELKEGGGHAAAESQVEVRMIDFAHVFPSQSRDEGYIYGLKHLLTVLEQILCDAA